MPATEDQIRPIILTLRSILDESDKSGWGVEWKTFPRGCCGTVAELTQYCVYRIAGMVPTIVRGTKLDASGLPVSHAWVEIDGVVVDLTRDQYHSQTNYIFLNDPFYGTWTQRREISPQHPAPGELQAAYFDHVAGVVRARLT